MRTVLCGLFSLSPSGIDPTIPMAYPGRCYFLTSRTMRAKQRSISFIECLIAISFCVVPASGTTMTELPAMHFDAWDGYNPFQYASQNTAQALATLLGGEVVESDSAPPQRLIHLGGQRYLNAGLVALTLMNNSYEVALQMIELEAFSHAGLGFNSEDSETSDPFNPLPGPGNPNLPPLGGGLPPGSQGPGLGNSTPPQETAEPAALFLFGSGLLGLSLLARRRRRTA